MKEEERAIAMMKANREPRDRSIGGPGNVCVDCGTSEADVTASGELGLGLLITEREEHGNEVLCDACVCLREMEEEQP